MKRVERPKWWDKIMDELCVAVPYDNSGTENWINGFKSEFVRTRLYELYLVEREKVTGQNPGHKIYFREYDGWREQVRNILNCEFSGRREYEIWENKRRIKFFVVREGDSCVEELAPVFENLDKSYAEIVKLMKGQYLLWKKNSGEKNISNLDLK